MEQAYGSADKDRDSENKNPIERQKKENDYHGKRN